MTTLNQIYMNCTNRAASWLDSRDSTETSCHQPKNLSVQEKQPWLQR